MTSVKSATLLYFLNPLVLFEFATNAHFDALMILLLATGIYFTARRKVVSGLTFMATAILIKFTAVLFLPFAVLFLILDAIKNHQAIKTIFKISLAGILALAIAAISYYHYWSQVGLKIFDGVRLQSDWFVNSLFTTLYVPIISLYQALFHQTIPTVSAKYLWLVLMVVAGLILFIFVGEGLVPSRKDKAPTSALRDTTTPASGQARGSPTKITFLFEICALFVILFLTFAQRSFWPWYATWTLLPAVFLKQDNKIRKIATLFTFSSLAYYIPLAFLGQNSVQILDKLQVLYGGIVFGPVIFYLVRIFAGIRGGSLSVA